MKTCRLNYQCKLACSYVDQILYLDYLLKEREKLAFSKPIPPVECAAVCLLLYAFWVFIFILMPSSEGTNDNRNSNI